MTRTVLDAALMMQACAGPDERDPNSLPAQPIDYVRALRGNLKGLRVAWSVDLGFAPVVDPEVAAACAQATKAFREAGARVEEVKLAWPSPKDSWYMIFCGGIGARLEPYLERRGEIDPGLLRIAEWYQTERPTAYLKAWSDRLAWWQHPRALFDTYDLLLTPTVACPPFDVNLDNPATIAGRSVAPYDWIPFTYPFNLTGQPASSVPCGFTKAGLPIGLQIVGRRFDDPTVLRASAAFERARPWAARRPPLV
jgi:aspartyl-tRNA(Asn)/glutamyl-tRNA(Gln) amidotransferase subunit A